VLPASDQPVRTKVLIEDGSWLGFQEYFVARRHADPVEDVRFEGAESSRPAPGVIEAIAAATAVVIGPSNPVLSIWPILAVPGLVEAVAAKVKVVGVSPLIGGTALKGPAHQVMASLGLPDGNAGVIAAYGGLLTDLFIDSSDRAQRHRLLGPRIHVADIRIPDLAASTRLAEALLEIL
jgi:LPPG:FO 2-phospho-L-lactate transferase